MPTQKEALDYATDYATHFGWTKADAERAFATIDLKQADELALLTAMVNFAGPTLLERQRLQGAQKGLVTRRNREIKEINLAFSEKVNEYEALLSQERSFLTDTISRIYRIANQFGFRDPWVEMLLEQYDEYQKGA